MQMVKELRTEYSSALASTCQRLSAALTANTSTSIYSVLSQAKLACAQVGPGMTPMQQHAMMDSLSSNIFGCLGELMANLASALDSRVFVATGRGLWDFVGRDLLNFVENLQVSTGQAPRPRAEQGQPQTPFGQSEQLNSACIPCSTGGNQQCQQRLLPCCLLVW
jgi:hypothetical protein